MSNDTIGAGGREWLLLTEQQRGQLRKERVAALEADLYRAQLEHAEAVDMAEQTQAAGRISELRRRIAVHMDAMLPVGLDDGREMSGPVSLSE